MSGYEMSQLKRKNECYKNLSDYLAKRVSKISKLNKFGLSRQPSFYKIDMEKEYSKFLVKSKIQPDEKFDAMILAGLQEQIEKHEIAGCKESIEAMFMASVRCHGETINKIAEICGIEL